MTRAWVLVCSELVESSGQGMANLALARYLVERGERLSVVAHTCAPDLHQARGVSWQRVPRPLRSAFLGERLLAHAGRRAASQTTARSPGARVVVNGGNCAWADVNWVHMVHAAWQDPPPPLPARVRLRLELARALDRRRERRIVPAARLVVANSERTRHDLEHHLGVASARIRTVYLGIDATRFGPIEPDEREQARRELDLPTHAPTAVFVGGIGHDRKKGLDQLLEEWPAVLAAQPEARLLIAGGGLLVAARSQAEANGVAGSIRLLGPVPHVERVLAAADLMVSPTRYDSYGMNVHEALCRGLPVVVSSAAGAAERIPAPLGRMVLPPPGPGTRGAWAERILELLRPGATLRQELAGFAAQLRSRSWRDMASELAAVMDEGSP